MQAFTTLTGIAAPLSQANIDTDVIIRIERLTTVPQAELGRYAFEALRYLPDGAENPDFALNRPAWRDAAILLAGANFGCGSSRESAVWALQGAGIRCVIAPSFGDIFYSNCFQNGVLPVVLPDADIGRLQQLAPQPLTVDLRRLRIDAGDLSIPFSVDPLRRQMLLEGLDEIGLTLTREAAINAWQQHDRRQRPWIWQPLNQQENTP